MVLEEYESGHITFSVNTNSTANFTLFGQETLTGNWKEIDSEGSFAMYRNSGEINLQNLILTQSPHKIYLQRAKEHMQLYVLSDPIPMLADMEIVLLLLGAALNKQIDKNAVAKSIESEKIIEKLKAVNRTAKNPYERRLLSDYTILNTYYNSTKHGSKPVNDKYEQHLCTSEGKRIIIHHFETTRRIFKWYYLNFSSSGIPQWDELMEIDYKKFNIDYDYNTYIMKRL